MAKELFIVVVYDISNDKRRTKLHKRLKDFGSPVQYSVFECILDKRQIGSLKKAVNKIIRPRLDHVRYYYLDKDARQRIEVTGRKEVTTKPKVIVV